MDKLDYIIQRRKSYMTLFKLLSSDIVLEKVVSIGKIERLQAGRLQSDYEYGFNVIFDSGITIPYFIVTKKDRMTGNFIDSDEKRISDMEIIRQSLIDAIYNLQ